MILSLNLELISHASIYAVNKHPMVSLPAYEKKKIETMSAVILSPKFLIC